ncbi:hypothetical protein GCM10022247_71400 [Allokutzneria multivorans]|uniref:Roadblock/LAMTOR2 domain-containing protein n=1 Tax=Allokutzneria multivorans TaxID=1142134 RepID=A0ABP7U3N7_9PSEU
MDTSGKNQLALSDQVISVARRLRQEVPDCLATGVVDMATGMLMACETTDSHPSEVLDLLAGATLELFQGRTVTMIEDIFKERRGVTSAERYFQEVLVNSTNLTHLFIRDERGADLVVVVVCPRAVNIGMLFAATRRVLKGHFALI